MDYRIDVPQILLGLVIIGKLVLPRAELCVMGTAELRGILAEMKGLVIVHVIQYLIGYTVVIEDRVDGNDTEGLVALSEAVFGHVIRPSIVRVADIVILHQTGLHEPLHRIYEVLAPSLLRQLKRTAPLEILGPAADNEFGSADVL